MQTARGVASRGMNRSGGDGGVSNGSSRVAGFTLIELLVVVAIISLLISILMPSLSRARDQSKGVHCLARLKDMANALAAYENENHDLMPPSLWEPEPIGFPELEYGWTEIVYQYIYKERVFDPTKVEVHSLPVQRNMEPDRWQPYFRCKASSVHARHSGHYRVYLPSWLMGTYGLDANGRYDLQGSILNPRLAASRTQILPRMPLIMDSNEFSERFDTSYIDAGEANTAGSAGHNGNRISDRHYGGTNLLFQDLSAHWERNSFRERLARDYDLNGINDVDLH